MAPFFFFDFTIDKSAMPPVEEIPEQVFQKPVPIPKAITDKPKTVVRAVIRIGLILITPAFTIASFFVMPSSICSLFMQSISTIPLFTMIPLSITNPKRDITLTSLPVMSSAKNPPVNTRGIVNITINGDLKFWN